MMKRTASNKGRQGARQGYRNDERRASMSNMQLRMSLGDAAVSFNNVNCSFALLEIKTQKFVRISGFGLSNHENHI